jgi:hypothetical protein
MRFFRQLVNLEKLYLSGNPFKFIEDDTFSRLNFLQVLDIDSYNPIDYYSHRLKMSNFTLKGLNSIKLLKVSRDLMSTLAGVRFVEVNLQPMVKEHKEGSLGLDLYGSINVVYQADYFTDWDCFVVLFSIRFNIQVNLMTDKSVNGFLAHCGLHSLNELKYYIDDN